MENLKEYLLRYQQYKEGNYEYDIITSLHDIKKLVEHGKKIVLIRSKSEALPYYLATSIFFIIGSIVSLMTLSGPFYWPIFFTILGMTFLPCLIFLIIGLWYSRECFMVLGPEGIVYKLRQREIKGFTWQDINIDFYNFSYLQSGGTFPLFQSVIIHVFVPDGDYIKVDPVYYSSKEVSTAKYGAILALIFTVYYELGKKRSFRWQAWETEETKEEFHPANNVMDTKMVIIDTWRDQLKEALHTYKKRKKNRDKIWTSTQLKDYFLRKKIFVLRGEIGIVSWVILSFPLVTLILALSIMNPIYETFTMNEILYIFIIAVIFWFSIISPFFIILRGFLVISSSGVYYRKFFRKKHFAWNEISKLRGTTKEDYPNLTKQFALVTITFLDGKKINFASNKYKNRDFSKKVYIEMFLNLFNINFKLPKNKFPY
ncbi:MAG: hypothetical protein ACW96X_02760 [Promethearchaeota archaeon]|jgi:hypothetical protein